MLKLKQFIMLFGLGYGLHSCSTHTLSMEPGTSKEGEPLQKKRKMVVDERLMESISFLSKKEQFEILMRSSDSALRKAIAAKISAHYTPENPYAIKLVSPAFRKYLNGRLGVVRGNRYEITLEHFEHTVPFSEEQMEYLYTERKTATLSFLKDLHACGHPIRHIVYQGPWDKVFFKELDALGIKSFRIEFDQGVLGELGVEAWDLQEELIEAFSQFTQPTVSVYTNVTKLGSLILRGLSELIVFCPKLVEIVIVNLDDEEEKQTLLKCKNLVKLRIVGYGLSRFLNDQDDVNLEAYLRSHFPKLEEYKEGQDDNSMHIYL